MLPCGLKTTQNVFQTNCRYMIIDVCLINFRPLHHQQFNENSFQYLSVQITICLLSLSVLLLCLQVRSCVLGRHFLNILVCSLCICCLCGETLPRLTVFAMLKLVFLVFTDYFQLWYLFTSSCDPVCSHTSISSFWYAHYWFVVYVANLWCNLLFQAFLYQITFGQ